MKPIGFGNMNHMNCDTLEMGFINKQSGIIPFAKSS